jgi:hypothetical protein
MAEPLLQLVKTQRGRGLAAASNVAAGTVILDEYPLAAFKFQKSTIGMKDEVCCPHCYRTAKECSVQPCLNKTPQVQHYLESLNLLHSKVNHGSKKSSISTPVLDNSEGGGRFPILTMKLAMLLHFSGDEAVDVKESINSLVAPRHALDSSLFPTEWKEAHYKALNIINMVNPEVKMEMNWFIGILGRLHLNSMRTDDGLSVFYSVGSFFNHGCRPNVAPEWNGGYVKWHTTQDVAEGEEYLIDYKGNVAQQDQNNTSKNPDQMPESARDEFLYWNYGFKCEDSCSCGRFSK